MRDRREKWLHITVWFILNVAVTMWNKTWAMFQGKIHPGIGLSRLFAEDAFPYTFLLSACHMLFTWIAAEIFQRVTKGGAAEGNVKDWIKLRELLIFSFVFSLNIWLSNYTLKSASLPLHQISRALIPLATLGLSAWFFSRPYPMNRLPPVLIIIAGVVLIIREEISWTLFQLFGLFCGCIVSSLKGILTCHVSPASLYIPNTLLSNLL